LAEVLHPLCAEVDVGLYKVGNPGGADGLCDGALRSENPQTEAGKKRAEVLIFSYLGYNYNTEGTLGFLKFI
jgi:hypothetical protein